MCRFKDGQEVTADAHIKITRDSQSLEDYSLTVTIVKGADAGDYEVHAENFLGTASTKSTVKVNSEYSCIFFPLLFSLVIFYCHSRGEFTSLIYILIILLLTFISDFDHSSFISWQNNNKFRSKHVSYYFNVLCTVHRIEVSLCNQRYMQQNIHIRH